jgi:hypothetical protein
MPGAEYSTTGVSLTALTEYVHSYAAIPPGRKCFLLMYYFYHICFHSIFYGGYRLFWSLWEMFIIKAIHKNPSGENIMILDFAGCVDKCLG